MRHTFPVATLFFVASFLLFCGSALAEEKKGIVGIGGAIVEDVGEAVGGTVSGLGKSAAGLGDTITGKTDVVAARKEIDANAQEALVRLQKASSSAKTLLDKSYGYAVFDSRKLSLLLTTGGGSGVVVEKPTGSRTYMRMATGGAGVGYGAQFYKTVFLFEDKQSLKRFVNSGWEASAAAAAVFGKNSLNADAKFVEGMAVYQLSDTGIMAGANLTGTKYWSSDELNAAS